MGHPAAHLIMIMGLPGSGKTYFATALAKHIGATHFNSDRIRKESMEQVHYTAERKARTYRNMFERVTDALSKGNAVIVDATFSKAAYREPYLQWSAAQDVPVHVLYMSASESVTAARVTQKRPDSDADLAVYTTIKAEYEPIVQRHLVLRSDEGSTVERIERAVEYIAQEPSHQ